MNLILCQDLKTKLLDITFLFFSTTPAKTQGKSSATLRFSLEQSCRCTAGWFHAIQTCTWWLCLGPETLQGSLDGMEGRMVGVDVIFVDKFLSFLTWPLILFWKSCPIIINWFASWSFEGSSIVFNLWSRSVTAFIQIGHQSITWNIHVTTTWRYNRSQESWGAATRDSQRGDWRSVALEWCGAAHATARGTCPREWRTSFDGSIMALTVQRCRGALLAIWYYMVLWHPEKNTTIA